MLTKIFTNIREDFLAPETQTNTNCVLTGIIVALSIEKRV